jgi:L-threonylcarbamoyladenylate synthase
MTKRVSTTVLSTHTPELFLAAVREAARLLRAGEVVALPTETVYGLAANALDPAAVGRIFATKGRPAHNPIIVHVASLEMARHCAGAWPTAADRLAASFWPGPLTMVLPKAPELPDAVTAGGSTVGIRWPSHPFMQAVIRECGFPLAAPSANRSNELSPTNAAHVLKSLGGEIPLIVDGGQAQVGIESTVVDISAEPARLLRPGMIHAESISAAVGVLASDGSTPGGPLRSPGMLLKHYAPKARLLVLSWGDDDGLQSAFSKISPTPQRVHVVAHTRIPQVPDGWNVSVIPHDAEAFARAIYAELHRCDEAEADLIMVEALPDTPEWRGVADRLKRAST